MIEIDLRLHDKYLKDYTHRKDLLKQREKLGFCPTEIWNLDITIIKFILPRLEHYRDICDGVPHGFFDKEDEWELAVDAMIGGCYDYIENDCDGDEEIRLKIQFMFEYFGAFWI